MWKLLFLMLGLAVVFGEGAAWATSVNHSEAAAGDAVLGGPDGQDLGLSNLSCSPSNGGGDAESVGCWWPWPCPGGDGDDGVPPPVPEPGTIALIGLGILGIVAARRRRRQ